MSGNGTGWRARNREAFDQATGSLYFTKDFNTSLEAIMADEMASNGQRVLAWLKRRSWGNYNLHCIRDDGTPAFQSDCARDLNLNKGTVSKIVAYLEQRGYVRLEGKILFPVIAPAIEPAEKVAKASTFATFLEHWKVAQASTFDAWQVAEAAAKEHRKVAMAAFHSWQRQQQNAPHPIESTETPEDYIREEENDGRTVSVPEAAEPAPRSSVVSPVEETVSQPLEQPREALRAWLTGRAARFGLHTVPDTAVLDALCAHITTAAVLHRFEEQVDRQAPKPKNWMYFAAIAKGCADSEAAAAVLERDQLAGKCLRCRGSGRHPMFVQEPCDACQGTGLPVALTLKAG